jgi:TolA-binding protein
VTRSGESGVSVSVERGRVEVRREGSSGVLQVLEAGQSWSVALELAAAPVPTQDEPKAEPEAPTDPEPAPSPSKPSAPTAKQLFERAQAARARGKLDEAASALRTLRQLYPNDPRASLAAFELARIQLDSKGDPKEAEKALKDAIDSAPPGAPHREDAEARRVEALDAAGDHAGCVAAKNAYLARYPKGVHRAQVSARCKKR